MTDKIDCPVVESLGTDDPNNVFTCNSTQTCCTVKLQPACCTKQDMNKAILMQVELWLPLLALIILLALFIWWCRTDEPCCDVEKPCLYRCGCKKYEDDEPEQVKEEDINGSRQSLRSTKSSTTLLHDAEVDPTELEEVAVELDAAPEDEDEPVVAPPEGEEDKGEDEASEEPKEEEEEEKKEEEPAADEENKEEPAAE